MEFGKPKQPEQSKVLIKLINNEMIVGEVIKDNGDTIEVKRNDKLVIVYKNAIATINIQV